MVYESIAVHKSLAVFIFHKNMLHNTQIALIFGVVNVKSLLHKTDLMKNINA